MKTRIRMISCLLCVLFALAIPVSANSAQTKWQGVDAAGAMVQDGECPIEVTREVLTFHIQEFPESYYAEEGDYLAYSGSVTAEYTFYNPADYTVTAKLLFPFGRMPDYGMESDDTARYGVTVDGEPVQTVLRHTLAYWGHQFDLETDLALLHDGFQSDAFYAPELPVTKYTYHVTGTAEEFRSACLGLELDCNPEKTRVYLENCNGLETTEEHVRAYRWVDGEDVCLYVLGEPMKGSPQWKIYENASGETEIDGEVELVSTEELTFRDLALLYYPRESRILEQDWYNAVVSQLSRNQGGCLIGNDYGMDVSRNLMRWYEYEITLDPGQTVVNTVTAPIYPGIDANSEPTTYGYTYLLSPAKTWASFGTLEIQINTPYYLLESSIEGFEANDQGYALKLSGLPEEELEFTLCTEASAGKESPGSLGQVLAVLAGGAVGIYLVSRRRKKKGISSTK